MQLGNITVPAVSTFKVSDISNPNESIYALGVRGVVLAEFMESLPKVEINGSVYVPYGDSRTLYQYKEDVEALGTRRACYNSVTDVKGRTGWISVTSVIVDDETGTKWPLYMEGTWLDAGQYQEELSSIPVTRANDWDITGTYDEDTAEASDDLTCYDGTTEIFSKNHIFSGNCVFENGSYKVELSANTVALYYFTTEWIQIDSFAAGTFDRVTIIEINKDIIKVKTSNDIEIELERGRCPYVDTPEDMTCSVRTPTDNTTTADNYLDLCEYFHVCSDQSFSIASNVIDAGRLWFFYAATVDASTVAHNALVVSNFDRRVVLR